MIDAEIRHRAVVHYKYYNRSLRKVSLLYKVSKSSLQRWVTKANIKHHRKKRVSVITEDIKAAIKQLIDSNPFLTMSQLAEGVTSLSSVKMSPKTCGRYTRKLGYTRKRAYKTVRHKTDHKSSVDRFCKEYLAVPTSDLLSIDEAGFYIGDTCRRGYCQRGKRLNIQISRTLRMSKLTLIAAVSAKGIVHYKILDHNCKKVDFVQFVSELHVQRGTVAVLDNIQFHHSKETISMFDSVGIRPLFVPPYSPEFNAIENVFSLLKRKYRCMCPIIPDVADIFDYSNALKRIIDAHDVSHQFDFSGYFEHVNSVSLDALNFLCQSPEDSICIDKIGYKS